MADNYWLVTKSDDTKACKLCLTFKPSLKLKPFFIDFGSNKTLYRLTTAKELLIKALGNNVKTVLDVTSGFCTDAFIMAAGGFKVTCLEKNTIIAKLVQDGLERATADTKISNIITNITGPIITDALDYLTTTKIRFDAIYLDPMFPETKSSTKSKKAAQVLQMVVGVDSNTKELFQLALTKAKIKVIVKRPKHSTPYFGVKPSYEITGKAVRFDVYYCNIAF